MFFHQQVLDGLGCFSYMIGSHQTGECVVVDPRRDVGGYLEIAADAGLTITHVIETHLHADHVSGCCELAARTGAAIYVHAAAGARYPHVPLHDGDRLVLGECAFDVLHTPGHTRDSICLLVSAAGAARFVLTGDTLLIGDVGRPDLVPGHPAEAMAGMLYDSLHAKLLVLPDELVVYPGHGAGSLCGRGLRAGASTTIGAERRASEALQLPSRDAFVAQLARNQPARPANDGCIKALNTAGPPLIGRAARLRPIPALEAARLLERGHVLVDLRSPGEYSGGHVPGAVNLSIAQGQFVSRAGQLLTPGAPIILLSDDTPDRPRGDVPDVERAAQALARVGYDQVVGFVDDGLCAWQAAGLPIARVPLWHASPGDVMRLLAEQRAEPPLLVDVREPSEWAEGHLPDAVHVPLSQLGSRAHELDPSRPVIVYCKSGVRSERAALLLGQLGHRPVYNLAGGITAWRAAGYPTIVDGASLPLQRPDAAASARRLPTLS